MASGSGDGLGAEHSCCIQEAPFQPQNHMVPSTEPGVSPSITLNAPKQTESSVLLFPVWSAVGQQREGKDSLTPLEGDPGGTEGRAGREGPCVVVVPGPPGSLAVGQCCSVEGVVPTEGPGDSAGLGHGP